jgi:hypothetical protein
MPFIGGHALRNYLAPIFPKPGVNNRIRLRGLAVRRGLGPQQPAVPTTRAFESAHRAWPRPCRQHCYVLQDTDRQRARA